MRAKDLKISYDNKMQPVVSFTLTSRSEVENLQTLADLDKPLSVEVKVYRKKRSNDANSMYFALVTQIAELIGKSIDELHIDLLRKYGHFELIKVVKEGADVIKRCFKFTDPYKEVTEGKWQFEIFKAYPSSSKYDTKQFSILLQGAIDEAKELGIDIVPDEEFKQLMSKYERKDK